MKSFPPPLTPKEESELLRRSADGDNEARHILIERNLRLVAHVIKKYQHLEDDTEDLLSIGTIGLIKAVSTFNPDKKARLATYACRCIENELLMMLRTKRKSNRETSLYEPIGTDREGNEIRLYDVIESDEEDACMQLALKNDISLLYEKLESVLTDREQLVLKKRYGLYGEKEYTQKEVAASLGISRSYVSRIEKGAIQKLRPCFLPSFTPADRTLYSNIPIPKSRMPSPRKTLLTSTSPNRVFFFSLGRSPLSYPGCPLWIR